MGASAAFPTSVLNLAPHPAEKLRAVRERAAALSTGRESPPGGSAQTRTQLPLGARQRPSTGARGAAALPMRLRKAARGAGASPGARHPARSRDLGRCGSNPPAFCALPAVAPRAGTLASRTECSRASRLCACCPLRLAAHPASFHPWTCPFSHRSALPPRGAASTLRAELLIPDSGGPGCFPQAGQGDQDGCSTPRAVPPLLPGHGAPRAGPPPPQPMALRTAPGPQQRFTKWTYFPHLSGQRNEVQGPACHVGTEQRGHRCEGDACSRGAQGPGPS